MASGHVNRIQRAEHMAAPTNAANVKKALANSEPSTHGTSRHLAAAQQFGRMWSEADINHRAGFMSTRLSSSPAHLPLPNALAQYRIAKLHIGFRGKGSPRLRPVAARW